LKINNLNQDMTTLQLEPIQNFSILNPNNFSILVNYRIEALPLKELIVKISNMSPLTFNSYCPGFNNNQTDCMEINETINIITGGEGNCPINNTIEMEFDYNLNQRINCTGITLTKIDAYKYRFNIVCKF
jgi:hypothetical protein